ncbi:MAG: small subunit ribosomal protein [Candidatus Peribacteria bacterium]|nr:small subunit ribosomal protein [Candidatus Peribacteria bacterium]
MSLITDPIGDLVTRLRNAQHARRETCRAPLSRIKLQACELLKKEGWIEDVQVIGEAPKQQLEVTFSKDKPALELKRMSKPGKRHYTGAKVMKPVLHGFGMAVLTTSQGLMTDRQAKKKNVGGEILFTIA